MTKICNRCYEAKPLKGFFKNASSPDGYSSICKTCKNLQKKEYRKENKKAIKEYAKEYYEDNKEKLKKYSKNRYDKDKKQ